MPTAALSPPPQPAQSFQMARTQRPEAGGEDGKPALPAAGGTYPRGHGAAPHPSSSPSRARGGSRERHMSAAASGHHELPVPRLPEHRQGAPGAHCGCSRGDGGAASPAVTRAGSTEPPGQAPSLQWLQLPVKWEGGCARWANTVEEADVAPDAPTPGHGASRRVRGLPRRGMVSAGSPG